MITTVTTKNMISIPTELSRKLGITPGCRFDWDFTDQEPSEIRIRIIPQRSDLARRLRGAGARWSPERKAVKELIQERSAEG